MVAVAVLLASAALLLAAAASQAGSTSPAHPLLDADSFSSLHLAAWRIEPPVEAPSARGASSTPSRTAQTR